MRATAPLSPIRNGKRRLLASCAITAGMVALAYGGPALAQVAGTGGFATGTGAINNTTNVTTVNVDGAQSIINWTPTDTATTGGAIDFLPNGNTLTFNGSGDYTVLNRFVDGTGGSLSREIALNGTVNSTDAMTSGQRGGNIWFYNAGGILIGATGVINVGSLVLTSNDIITTGGLFGPGGTIRFSGTAGSTSAITVNGAINANKVGSPGSSYIALVAPRVVQAGAVRVDGSAAYVAAEVADIRINSGLFDINVTRGVEGGNAITHTGTTTGPAHLDSNGNQSRIYMVAIPKNDAVTMLVSGAIGYDDALSAQVDPDGAVRLSAGYNITNGEQNFAPANATPANIIVNDTLFRSSTTARATGTFVGQALQQLPATPPPLSSAGQIFVEGDAVFSGDAGASLTIGANQRGGATGNLTIRSDGAPGAAGNVAVNVSGGTLSTGNLLQITSLSQPATVTGNSVGGTASLTITGGTVTAPVVSVSASAVADIGTNGQAGSARGGNASISVSNAGTVLDTGAVSINASAFGPTNISVATGGDGQGGTATLTVSNGASFRAANDVSINANGNGGFGPVQSGNGTGGTARIEISGANTSFLSADTSVVAQGNGGGSSGPVNARNGGDGTGGRAEFIVNADNSATTSLGALLLDARGLGGDASNSENTTGGDALGGTASLTVDGGVNAQFTQIKLDTSAQAGIASSPSGTSGQSGNARANNVTLTAANGATIDSSGGIELLAAGMGIAGENFGSGTGGDVAISATTGGTITAATLFQVQATGGSASSLPAQSAGSGTGGNVDFVAVGGTISAETYDVDVRGQVVSVADSNGTTQGGSIDLLASNAGTIRMTGTGENLFNAGASTGISAGGSSAIGGTIRLIANAGGIDFGTGTTKLTAGGLTGGAYTPGSGAATGTGGTILIRNVSEATNSSAMNLGGLNTSVDGRVALETEIPPDTDGNGQGGILTIDVQGGTLTADSLDITANGVGGEGGGSTGRGGTAIFTQTGGDVSINSMSVRANGFGGSGTGGAGNGIGGTATITLQGGTIDAVSLTAAAEGRGGQGADGNDFDPLNPVAGSIGGIGRGGTATINIEGSATVNAGTITASAIAFGGVGGDFFNASSFGGTPGTPGNGGEAIGGNAAVNIRGGTTTTTDMVADASGFGGDGGNSFFSSSSGTATGVGTGGTGGAGRGGTATIALASPVTASNLINSVARGFGGDGGSHNVGGNGGDGFGGTAQAIVTGFDVGDLSVILDAGALGGTGADANDGNGGNGGNGFGGIARAQADGAGGRVAIVDGNFLTDGVGGNGGRGRIAFGSSPATAYTGGTGGRGTGGTIEAVASNAATLVINATNSGGIAFLDSQGRGGNGGSGASYFGGTGGDGGDGGAGTGGSVNLIANGGTIALNGNSLSVTVNGVSGDGGLGADGSNGVGAIGATSTTTGGNVLFEASNGPTSAGQIQLGLTGIAANGDTAGRVVFRGDGSIAMTELNVLATGLAAPTNNDVDTAASGIFFAPVGGGSITTTGDMELTSDGSVGIYAQSGGAVAAGGALTIQAGDQVDIRHDGRVGTASTVRATGNLGITAGTSISGAPGSLLGAGGTLSLTANGPTATIGVDRLDAANIVISSSGAASIEHAEATGDFTATAGSFRTGLNSIITGGDISITSPGAVDLGNSTAGGFVQVQGQSIVFNNIDAGLTVGLSADGTAAGAEGISGGSITAGEDINLFANSIALTGTVAGDASFFAFGTGGPVSVNEANVDGTISIFSAANLTGTYVAGGNIFLNSNADITASAQANGGYVDGNGNVAEGNLFVIATGNAALSDSSAGRMFGVNAGLAASVNGGTAGEDMLVLAGTTAGLTDITAGDDITVRAPGNITALNVRTTGAGADTHILDFAATSGSPTFTIGVGEGTDGTNGADIVMASTAGAINATTLSAGDDILLNAATSIGLNGATTLGLGTTGGDSSIRTQGGATTLAGLNSFSDVVVDAAGLANLAGPVAAGRNATINAADVSLATLSAPGGGAIDTLTAGGNIVVNSSAGIAGGGVQALGDVTLTAGTAIGLTTIGGVDVALTGATGVAADRLFAAGTTSLDSANGNIQLGALISSGPITASANAIRIDGGGDMSFANLTTDVGDAVIRGGGDLSIVSGNVAGLADIRTSGESLSIVNLTANRATLENTGGFMNLDTVTVAGSLSATTLSSLGINGVVTGQAISLASANINIGSAARVGTAGTTQQLSVANNNNDNQTFIGGTGTRSGYHLDANELTRLYGSQIAIFAPEVQAAGGGSVGSAAPPDVIVDTFTLAGGAAGSNLGANGSLTIRTPGKMRVIGNVQLTGLTDANTLNLVADDALEVILGQGTVRLVNGTAPAGQLNMVSADIIVATQAAITAVGAATTTDAINTRLRENDGVVLDEGALFARGIRANVAGGFYVQNSGAGTDFGQRRGLTFGAGGLSVQTQGPSRIVLNGVQIGANGQVTGLDVIPLLTIAPQPNGVAGTFDPRSTLNGCFIANPAACNTLAFESNFPVQDVIEEETDAEGEDGAGGQSLPIPLITMRDIDPLTGEPLLDDPVTGAGNDDLWTSPTGQP